MIRRWRIPGVGRPTGLCVPSELTGACLAGRPVELPSQLPLQAWNDGAADPPAGAFHRAVICRRGIGNTQVGRIAPVCDGIVREGWPDVQESGAGDCAAKGCCGT